MLQQHLYPLQERRKSVKHDPEWRIDNLQFKEKRKLSMLLVERIVVNTDGYLDMEFTIPELNNKVLDNLENYG